MIQFKTTREPPSLDRFARFAAGVAAAATRSTNSAPPASVRADPRLRASTGVPSAVIDAIAAAATTPRVFQIACGLFAMDYGETEGRDNVAQGRLEHAIARALFDAWKVGGCSIEALGSAYALVADRVAGPTQWRRQIAESADCDSLSTEPLA
jgi:hypothetical protein